MLPKSLKCLYVCMLSDLLAVALSIYIDHFILNKLVYRFTIYIYSMNGIIFTRSVYYASHQALILKVIHTFGFFFKERDTTSTFYFRLCWISYHTSMISTRVRLIKFLLKVNFAWLIRFTAVSKYRSTRVNSNKFKNKKSKQWNE